MGIIQLHKTHEKPTSALVSSLTFYIFFKNHCCLPINQTVKILCKDTFWKDDIAILQAFVKYDGVVNMRCQDAKIANFAIKK